MDLATTDLGSELLILQLGWLALGTQSVGLGARLLLGLLSWVPEPSPLILGPKGAFGNASRIPLRRAL